MAIAFSVIIGAAVSIAYFSPWLWRQHVMSKLARRVSDGRVLALTFDDGPNPSLTPLVLDLLRKYDAAATFFLVGKHARRYPDIVERIRSEGHEIGCHSDQHLNAWKTAPWRAVADINDAYKTLSTWLPPKGMFRPPHGKMTLPTYLAIRRRGAKVRWWTVDSGDTHKALPSTKMVEDAVISKRGAIVLMHDLHLQNQAEERDRFVIETTTALLELARRESLTVRPVGQI